MPIYEYRCEACGAPKEAIQKMSDAPLKTCEVCGADALQRVMSRTSFVLKGGGWYATDYKPAPKEAKAEGSSSASSSSSASTASSSSAPATSSSSSGPKSSD